MTGTVGSEQKLAVSARPAHRTGARTSRGSPLGRLAALALRALSIFCIAFGLLLLLVAWLIAATESSSGASRVALMLCGLGFAASLGVPALWLGFTTWRWTRYRARRDELDQRAEGLPGRALENPSIPSSERIDESLETIFACVVLGLLGSFLIGAWFGGEFFLAGVFLVCAVGFWWLPVRGLVRRIRLGTGVLHLERVPVALGGRISGIVRLSRPLGQGSLESRRLQIRLCCLRKLRKTRRSVRFEKIVLYEAGKEKTLAGNAQEFSVDFEIPATERETDASDYLDQIAWRLECSYSLNGRTHEIGFDVPVQNRRSADCER